MNINLREIYDQNRSLIQSVSDSCHSEFHEIDEYLQTINGQELLLYAFSFGYYSVTIQKFGCSFSYMKSKIPEMKGVKQNDTTNKYLSIQPEFGSVCIPIRVKYNTLRELLSKELQKYNIHRNISNIIRDYLLRPEPKAEYGPK